MKKMVLINIITIIVLIVIGVVGFTSGTMQRAMLVLITPK